MQHETVGEDFRPAPVMISLSLRYPNGVVNRSAAQALSYNDSSLRVLTTEEFEKGNLLKVLAPFLKGIVSCRVSSTVRSREQPGFFELELRFLKKPVPAARPKKDRAVGAARLFSRAKVVLAAEELAGRLERGEALRFSQVLQEIGAPRRPFCEAVSAVAIMLLLQDRAALDLRQVLDRLKISFAKAGKDEG
jgi:hypothetical protein